MGPFFLERLDDLQQFGMHLTETHEERLDGGIDGDAAPASRVRLDAVDEHFQARIQMP